MYKDKIFYELFLRFEFGLIRVVFTRHIAKYLNCINTVRMHIYIYNAWFAYINAHSGNICIVLWKLIYSQVDFVNCGLGFNNNEIKLLYFIQQNKLQIRIFKDTLKSKIKQRYFFLVKTNIFRHLYIRSYYFNFWNFLIHLLRSLCRKLGL